MHLLDDLPDHFMISLFKRFTLKERLLIAQVCKKWYAFAHDPRLWRKFDTKSFKCVNLAFLKTLVDTFGSESMNELILRGSHEFKSAKMIDLRECDQDFLALLHKKSPNIEIITIEYMNLSNLSIKQLIKFHSLNKISFNWCLLSQNWFTLNEIYRFDHLISLKLIRITSLSKQDLVSIVEMMPFLRELIVSETKSSLTDESIKHLTKLRHLETLELINTQITDESIREFTRSYTFSGNLIHLNLSMSSYLTNLTVQLIGTYFFNLKKLLLTSCFGLTDITCLENLIKLKYLNLNNTSVSRLTINNCKLRVIGYCEIEYGHEKILCNKLAWTVNGSRNSVCSF